jgi:hypothetical protein
MAAVIFTFGRSAEMEATLLVLSRTNDSWEFAFYQQHTLVEHGLDIHCELIAREVVALFVSSKTLPNCQLSAAQAVSGGVTHSMNV